VNFIQVDLFFDHIWPDPDTWSIETARKQIRGVVEQVPDGTVMIRFHVNAPKWWLRSHPEEHVGYFGRTPRPEPPYGLNRLLEGDPFCPERVSFASSTWRETAKKRIRRFLRELSETKEGEAVTAVQIAEGIYGEWHYWGFIHGEADSSPVMGEYFRGCTRRSQSRRAIPIARARHLRAAARKALARRDGQGSEARTPVPSGTRGVLEDGVGQRIETTTAHAVRADSRRGSLVL
jgi:hypothetical protein